MMTTVTARHETQIAADPSVPTIVITREFDAPPERVFRAHGEPDGVSLATMRFEDLDGRTRVRLDELLASS